MITLEAHYVYLLLGSTAIMLALACLSFARFENRCREIEEFWKSPSRATPVSKRESRFALRQASTNCIASCN